MPTYDYVCEACGHEFEHFQAMSDKHLRTCPKCKKKKLVRKVGAGAGLIFKGTGFYITDYKKSATSPAGDSGSSKSGPTARPSWDRTAVGGPPALKARRASGAGSGSGTKSSTEAKSGAGSKPSDAKASPSTDRGSGGGRSGEGRGNAGAAGAAAAASPRGGGLERAERPEATGPRDPADRLDLLCVRRGGAARRALAAVLLRAVQDGGLGRVAPGTLPHSRRGRRRRRPSRARARR